MGLQRLQELREAWLHLLHEGLLELDDDTFGAAHAHVIAHGQPSGAEKSVFVEAAIIRERAKEITAHV